MPITPGRRSTGRLRVRLSARLILLSGTRNCVLTDLSGTGARVVCGLGAREPFQSGEEAMLLWGEFEAFGRLVWTAGASCGLAFGRPIPRPVLLKTRDLDKRERLPDDRETLRRTARQFAEGRVRL